MSDFERFECPACERWECNTCGNVRYYSSKSYEGRTMCANCGSRTGTKHPIRHSNYLMAMDHLEDFKQEQMAENDIKRIQEAIMAETKRLSSEYTGWDFGKAEWATHPDGMFAHRNSDIAIRAKWAVTTQEDEVNYYTDDELAARKDFTPVQTGGKPQLSQERLDQELSNSGLQDVEYPAIIKLLEAVGVDVEPVKPTFPEEPGARVWLKARFAGVSEYLVVEGGRFVRLEDGLMLSRQYVTTTFEVVESPE